MVCGLGRLGACAREALYEPDGVLRRAQCRPAACVGGGGGGPELPAADEPAVVARFLKAADGPLAAGQSFTPGALRPAERAVLRVDGQRLPTDLAVMATHPDGSVRHAVVSTTLPSGTARRATPGLLVRLP